MFQKYLKFFVQQELKTVFEENKKSLFHKENGYNILVCFLAGLRPDINTIGIITAENPMSQQTSDKKNKKQNKKLANDLIALEYKFSRVTGKYRNIEKPYIVFNIFRNDIIRLGKKYKQESVIFIKTTDESNLAQLIKTNRTNKAYIADEVLLPVIEDINNLYTKKKLVIPFRSY